MPLPDALSLDLAPASALGLDLDQYLGAWAIEESRFSAQLSYFRSLNLQAHVAANGDRRTADVSQRTVGSVAVIDIVGTMTKRGSSMSEAGATVRLRQAVRAAANDPDISAILLRVDSPGGTVAGTADLGDEVFAARQQKPVYAYVEDMAASAAYWVSSQAEKVYANRPDALVGSIGTVFGIYDLSRAAKNEGVEAVLIRTSSLKGAGFPGAEITDEQKAVWQDVVDGSQEQFNAAVMRGRGMSSEQVAAVATGRVYRASEGQKLGLVDGVKSFDQVLAELTQVAAKRKKVKPMAASYEEITQACAGCDPSVAEDALFVTDQLRKGAEASDAARAWAVTLKQRAAVAREEAAAAKADAEAKAAEAAEKARADAEAAAASKVVKLQGTDPLVEARGKTPAADAGYTGDPVADFDIAVRERIAAGTPRKKACVAAAKANPELHKAFLLATNVPKAHAAIRERFSAN